jgi:hypothetical protein
MTTDPPPLKSKKNPYRSKACFRRRFKKQHDNIPLPKLKRELGASCGRDKFTQFERLIYKFGGASNLARSLGAHITTVYKWSLPEEKGGSGGVIPGHRHKDLLRAARVEGIYLTSRDFDPRPLPITDIIKKKEA